MRALCVQFLRPGDASRCPPADAFVRAAATLSEHTNTHPRGHRDVSRKQRGSTERRGTRGGRRHLKERGKSSRRGASTSRSASIDNAQVSWEWLFALDAETAALARVQAQRYGYDVGGNSSSSNGGGDISAGKGGHSVLSLSHDSAAPLVPTCGFGADSSWSCTLTASS